MAAAAVEGWTNARSAAGDRNPWLIAVVVSISAFMEVLDTSIANVSLQHIGGGLAVSYDETTWVLTSYLIANAIVIPASGWLSTVLGRKRYYMISVAVFTAASFVCGIAPNLTVLILARIVQGAAGGGLQPSTQSMLIDSFPPSKRGAALGLFGFTIVLAPAVGPVLGGWITDTYHWSWIFLINVPVGLLSLFLVQTLVAEPKALQEETKKAKAGGLRFDLTGFAFIAVGLATLEIAADRGQQDNWFSNPTITICAILAVVGLVGFVIWENTKKTDTLLDLSLFKNRNFLICNLVMMITGVVLYGTTQFLPQLLQQVQGYTATSAGLAMTFGGLATLIAMPIAAGLSNKVQPRWLILFGLVVEALALLNMTGLSTEMSFWDAAFSRVWQAIGIPFLFVPLTNAAYVGLPPESTNQASAMLNVFRNLGGTLGISSVQTLLAQREQFHQSRLVENLNPLNPAYTSALQTASGALRPQLGFGADQGAMAQIYANVSRQAAMLSYVDVFWGLMLFVALVTPCAFLLKKAPQGGAEGGAA